MTGPEQIIATHRRDLRRDGITWIVVALILLLVLGFMYRSDKAADERGKRLEASNAQIESLKGAVGTNGQLAKSAKNAADEANRRLAAAGKPTVPVPTEAPVSPSVTPPAQQHEFSADESAAIRVIVADQIARTPAKLTQAEVTQIARIAAALVPKPKDGKTPTAAELQPIVTATLAAYCVDDKCVGKTGRDGQAGPEGPAGKDAPAVTDEQLLAAAKQALAAYCAQDSQPCKGPQGEPGASITGPPGRGIADTDCQDDGSWLITYTDGNTSTTDGPCRVGIAPTGPATPGLLR